MLLTEVLATSFIFRKAQRSFETIQAMQKVPTDIILTHQNISLIIAKKPLELKYSLVIYRCMFEQNYDSSYSCVTHTIITHKHRSPDSDIL